VEMREEFRMTVREMQLEAHDNAACYHCRGPHFILE